MRVSRINEMYEAQKKLIFMYHPEFGDFIPAGRDSFEQQQHLRSLYGYICEEVSEVLAGSNHLEELVDVYHFLLEFAIMSNLPVDCFYPQPRRKYDNLFHSVTDFHRHLGTCVHAMKKKPWRKEGPPTDAGIFLHSFEDALIAFDAMCFQLGADEVSIYREYMRKQEVNRRRTSGEPEYDR